MNNVEKDIVIDYTENNLSLEFLYRRYRCPKIEIVEILQRNNIKSKDYFILEKEVLKDLYIEQNKTIADIANYYKQPVRNIKRWLVYYDINKSPEEVKQARLEKIKSSNLEKYGVEYNTQREEVKKKLSDYMKNKDSINNENNYFSLGRDFIHKKDYLKKENAIQNLYRIKTIDNKILFQEDLKNIDKNNCKFIIKEVGTIKF